MAGSGKGRGPARWSRFVAPFFGLGILIGAVFGVRYILAHPELVFGGQARKARATKTVEGWSAI